MYAEPHRKEKQRAAAKRWRERHPDRVKKTIANWKLNNPEKYRTGDRKRSSRTYYRTTHNSTKEEVKALIAAHPYCSICHRKTQLVPDHDHATGTHRGILCGPCNRAIGILGDTIEGLERALAYLKCQE